MSVYEVFGVELYSVGIEADTPRSAVEMAQSIPRSSWVLAEPLIINEFLTRKISSRRVAYGEEEKER